MYYTFMQSPLGPSVRVHKEVIVSVVNVKKLESELKRLRKFIKYKMMSYESNKIRDLMFLAKIDSDLLDVFKGSTNTLAVITIRV